MKANKSPLVMSDPNAGQIQNEPFAYIFLFGGTLSRINSVVGKDLF